jgi:hypothetical protein
MYTFHYKGEDHVTFNSCQEAIDWFHSKGYGMYNWTITRNSVVITLDEFNDFRNLELFGKKL